MATLNEKLVHLEEVKAQLEALLDTGVDPKSPAAAPIGLEFIHAVDAVARELGYEILKPIDEK